MLYVGYKHALDILTLFLDILDITRRDPRFKSLQAKFPVNLLYCYFSKNLFSLIILFTFLKGKKLWLSSEI